MRLDKHILSRSVALGTMFVLVSGCAAISVKHEMEPIYATVDINIRIQKELEDFFDFETARTERNKVDANKKEEHTK